MTKRKSRSVCRVRCSSKRLTIRRLSCRAGASAAPPRKRGDSLNERNRRQHSLASVQNRHSGVSVEILRFAQNDTKKERSPGLTDESIVLGVVANPEPQDSALDVNA